MEDGYKILVVDDSPAICSLLDKLLSERGNVVAATCSSGEAVQLSAEAEFEVVVSDIRMPGVSGMELLKAVKERDERTSVVLITGYASIRTAIEALELGAESYLLKPFGSVEKEVIPVIERAAQKCRVRRENTRLSKELKEASSALKKTNARLRKTLATFGLLQHFSALKNGCSDEESILSLTDETLAEGFGVRKYAIMLLDGAGSLVTATQRGMSSAVAEAFHIRLHDGPLGKAVAAGFPNVLERPKGGRGQTEWPIPPELDDVTHVFVLPILACCETIGSLLVFGAEGESELKEDLTNIFSMIASELGSPLALIRERRDRALAEASGDRKRRSKTGVQPTKWQSKAKAKTSER